MSQIFQIFQICSALLVLGVSVQGCPIEGSCFVAKYNVAANDGTATDIAVHASECGVRTHDTRSCSGGGSFIWVWCNQDTCQKNQVATIRVPSDSQCYLTSYDSCSSSACHDSTSFNVFFNCINSNGQLSFGYGTRLCRNSHPSCLGASTPASTPAPTTPAPTTRAPTTLPPTLRPTSRLLALGPRLLSVHPYPPVPLSIPSGSGCAREGSCFVTKYDVGADNGSGIDTQIKKQECGVRTHDTRSCSGGGSFTWVWCNQDTCQKNQVSTIPVQSHCYLTSYDSCSSSSCHDLKTYFNAFYNCIDSSGKHSFSCQPHLCRNHHPDCL